MSHSDTHTKEQFAAWVDDKVQVARYELGDKFAVPPTTLASHTHHPETTDQQLEEVLLEHESPTPELLSEIAALEQAPPLSDEELARQALAAGGADNDPNTPE